MAQPTTERLFCRTNILQRYVFCIQLTLFHTVPSFHDPTIEGLRKQRGQR